MKNNIVAIFDITSACGKGSHTGVGDGEAGVPCSTSQKQQKGIYSCHESWKHKRTVKGTCTHHCKFWNRIHGPICLRYSKYIWNPIPSQLASAITVVQATIILCVITARTSCLVVSSFLPKSYVVCSRHSNPNLKDYTLKDYTGCVHQGVGILGAIFEFWLAQHSCEDVTWRSLLVGPKLSYVFKEDKFRTAGYSG